MLRALYLQNQFVMSVLQNVRNGFCRVSAFGEYGGKDLQDLHKKRVSGNLPEIPGIFCSGERSFQRKCIRQNLNILLLQHFVRESIRSRSLSVNGSAPTKKVGISIVTKYFFTK
jgi:hypothetical protein